MAQVTTKKIVEGNIIVMRVDLLSDGASGELVNQVILSPSELINPRQDNLPCFKIDQIWYGCSWFDVSIGFGTLQPQSVWTITRDGTNHVDFRSFGGLCDYRTTPPQDGSGKVWISTSNFAPAGSQGTLIIQLHKTNRQPQL